MNANPLHLQPNANTAFRLQLRPYSDRETRILLLLLLLLFLLSHILVSLVL